MMPLPRIALCLQRAALLLLTAVAVRAEAESPGLVSFAHAVMAVLSKAGCNSGPCHGNQNGKAGFKLSLRGEDAEFDLKALTRDMFARRVNPNDPDQSLLLLKATTQLAHEGGLRFRSDSPEYAMLRRWIADGAGDDAGTAPKLARLEVSPTDKILVDPVKETQLRVRASFSDGTERDVTSLAVYEPATTALKVGHDGLATCDMPVETTVLVRYLDKQAPVRLAFSPAPFTQAK